MKQATLKIFIDLVETENFTATGKRNNLTQSAVSQQLKQLETALNCQLLIRSKNNVLLTQKGIIFYRYAKEIYAMYESLISEISLDKKIKIEENLSIVASHAVSGTWLIEPTKLFIKENPFVNIKWGSLSEDHVINATDEGYSEIGIGVCPDNKNIKKDFLFKEHFYLACSKNSPLAKKKIVSLKEIKNYPFLAFKENLPTAQIIEQHIKKHKVKITPFSYFDNVGVMKCAIENDNGIAIIPECGVKHSISFTPNVVVVQLAEPFTRDICIMTKKNNPLSESAKRYIKIIKEQLYRP